MYRDRSLLLVCGAQLCMAIGMGLVDPVLPTYAYSFGISYTLVGVIMSSFGLTRIFVEIPGGLLTDRFGQKKMMLMGNGLAVGSHLLAGFATTALALTVSRMVMGVGSALSLIATLMYVMNIATEGQKSRYLATYQSTFSIAGILGPTIGGFISEMVGVRAIFGVSTAISLMGVGLFTVLRQPVSPRPATPESTPPFHWKSLVNRNIIVPSFATFMMFLLFSGIRGTMIPLYGSEYLQLTSVQIGMIFSLTSVVIVVGLLVISARLEQIIARSTLLPLSLFTCAFAAMLLAFSRDFLTLTVLSIPLGLGFSLLQPIPFAMINDHSPPYSGGKALGFARTLADMGIILGPTLVGWIIDLGHPLWVFYVVATIIGLFAIMTWYLLRSRS
ncbi:MAG: MFS transporter [Candidatus Hermodarchaeia archaeon]